MNIAYVVFRIAFYVCTVNFQVFQKLSMLWLNHYQIQQMAHCECDELIVVFSLSFSLMPQKISVLPIWNVRCVAKCMTVSFTHFLTTYTHTILCDFIQWASSRHALIEIHLVWNSKYRERKTSSVSDDDDDDDDRTIYAFGHLNSVNCSCVCVNDLSTGTLDPCVFAPFSLSLSLSTFSVCASVCA